MAQQGRLRRSSLEAPSAPTACYQDAAGAYAAGFDQDAALSLLLAAAGQQHNGYAHGAAAPGMRLQPGGKADPALLAAAAAAAAAGAPGVDAAGMCMGLAPVANGYDSSSPVDAEEPGPLPCLPRRTLGSAGPYGSAAAAFAQQQAMRGGARPRRHSVTIGMLNEHQQQQQAAAYAAALAAAQQGGLGAGLAPGAMAGAGQAANLRMLRGLGAAAVPQLHQQQQQQFGAAPSPAKQQLHALSNMQAVAAAAAAGLGMAGGPLLGGNYGLAQQQQQQQQPAAVDALLQQQLNNAVSAASCASPGMPMGGNGRMPGAESLGSLTELQALQLGLNAPRLPNAGGCRRHSWAPTGANGSNAYALLLQQQQQQQQRQQLAALGGGQQHLGPGAAALHPAAKNGLNGMNGMNGVNGLNGLNGLNGMHGLNGVHHGPAGPYTNGAPVLNGSGPPSGSCGGLSPALLMQLGGLPGAQLPGAGFDLAAEQQQLAQHLLQLQQQAGLAVLNGQRDSLVEALLDPGTQASLAGAQQPGAAALLPSLAGANPFGAGGAPALLPGATTGGMAAPRLPSPLGLDADGYAGGAAAAAAAASNMYAPLQVNGVTLDSQLLVSPFADNWAACAAGAKQMAGSQFSYGVKSPTASPGLAGAAGAAAAPAGAAGHAAGVAGGNGHGKGHKALPTRTGSSSSNSSNGSANHVASQHVNGSTKHLGSSAAASAVAPSAAAPVASAASAEAALAAVASMVASLPPQSKVCSDAPWDLKKAAEDDAKGLAAQQQQVDRLLKALQHSTTLQRVAQASGSGGAAASGVAAKQGKSSGSGGGGSERQQVLFGYQLPDTGADAWGGSTSAAAESMPGAGCISQEPSNKLFVGNIGWWVTEEDLLHWFSRFGTVVNVKIMYNSRKMHKPKDKWRSREYGFIDYATPDEAAKAIVWMDGVELPDLMKDTCGIIVQYAKPTTGASGSGSGNASGSGSGQAAASSGAPDGVGSSSNNSSGSPSG